MNFLAHAYLATQDEALIVGGVIGDWIKGYLPGVLPADLARGVAMHRAIDAHAETCPAFQTSRQRVMAPRRRYAGILVDMFYDHLLARDWRQYHAQPLHEFCRAVYAGLAARRQDLPAGLIPHLALMAEEDWLGSYASISGLSAVLARMSRRARHGAPLLGGEAELLENLEGFEADFQAWHHEAQSFVRAHLITHPACPA